MKDKAPIMTVVAIGVTAGLAYGLVKAQGKSTPTKHIEAYNNTIVNIGGTVDLTADDIHSILEGFSDKKTLAKNAVKVIKPAKSDPSASIKISDITSLEISSDVVSEAPSAYEPPVPVEREEKYKSIPIVIYASDRDRTTSNWAGIIPGIADKRIKFELSDSIDPKKLHGKTNIKADITLVSKYNNKTKTHQPVKAIIRGI